MKSDFQPKRILILQTAFIGDVILTLPLLQRTKRLFPEAKIDFVTIPTSKNLLETHSDIHRLLIFDKKNQHKSVTAIIKFAKELQKEKYELAITPHRSIRSALVIFLSKIPNRIGFDRSAGSFLFTKIEKYPYKKHEVNRNLSLLSSFKIDHDEHILPKLYFTDSDFEKINIESKIRHFNKEKYVVMAPGSVWATKRWLPEHFQKLAEMLINLGYNICLVGGSGDIEICNEIAYSKNQNIYNFCGALSLRESALLIKNAALCVTNDSAPLHLAVAVETKTVAIFGPTVTDFGFYPYGKNDVVAEIKDLNCRPCGKHGAAKCPIDTFECMRNLLPKSVFDLCKNMLS